MLSHELAQSLVRVMQETAGAPDFETFHRALFEQVARELEVQWGALDYRGPIGPHRRAQPADAGGRKLSPWCPAVVAEMQAFLEERHDSGTAEAGGAVKTWTSSGACAAFVHSSAMRAVLTLQAARRGCITHLAAFLDALAPYLRGALDHVARLERRQVHLDGLEQLARMTKAALLVSGRGQVTWISREARQLLDSLTPSTEIPEPLLTWLEHQHDAPDTDEDECLLVHGTWLHLRRRRFQSSLGAYSLVTIDDPVHRQLHSFKKRCDEIGLTPREREIAQLIARGRLNKEIASSLGISLNTVKNHAKRLYAGAGVRNRAEFVRLILHA